METLGQFLKREREFRGMTLEDLAKATKINSSFLYNMEADRWEVLPKGSFVKGYLKSYALHVGLNVEEVLARHQKQSQGSKNEEDPFRKFRGLEIKNQIFLIILFLVIVITLATFLSSR